jgi:hypothetical protein
MGPNRVGGSLPSPEDRKQSSFHNVVFFSYLEFGKMDEVHKPRYFEICVCILVLSLLKKNDTFLCHKRNILK